MPAKSQIPRLRHMIDAIEEIRSVPAEIDETAFAKSRRMRFVVERAFQIISEAARNLPLDLKARHPDLPWRDIADMGNLLRHEYQRVDPTLLWRYASHDIAQLEHVCKKEMERGS